MAKTGLERGQGTAGRWAELYQALEGQERQVAPGPARAPPSSAPCCSGQRQASSEGREGQPSHPQSWATTQGSLGSLQAKILDTFHSVKQALHSDTTLPGNGTHLRVDGSVCPETWRKADSRHASSRTVTTVCSEDKGLETFPKDEIPGASRGHSGHTCKWPPSQARRPRGCSACSVPLAAHRSRQ